VHIKKESQAIAYSAGLAKLPYLLGAVPVATSCSELLAPASTTLRSDRLQLNTRVQCILPQHIPMEPGQVFYVYSFRYVFVNNIVQSGSGSSSFGIGLGFQPHSRDVQPTCLCFWQAAFSASARSRK
jgi:hypothetical protein